MEIYASAPGWKSIKCREFDEVCGWPLISKEKSINCSLYTQLCLTIAVIYPHWIWHRSVIKAIVKARVVESRKFWVRRTIKSFKIALLSSEANSKMFSMDPFDFETVMSRHLFEGSLQNLQNTGIHSSNSNSSNDYFLCDDSITDTDSFNSDQENNNEIKEWVFLLGKCFASMLVNQFNKAFEDFLFLLSFNCLEFKHLNRQ